MKTIVAFFVVLHQGRTIVERRDSRIGLPYALLPANESIESCGSRAVSRHASIGNGLGRWRYVGGKDGESWKGQPVQICIFSFPNADIASAPTHPGADLVDLDALSDETDISIELLRKLNPAPGELALRTA